MTTICARTWSDEVLRIVCISDTHSRERNTQLDIPNGDVLIHAGDFSRSGMLPDLRHFKSFLDELPHKQKILVAGNHELTLHSDLYAANAKSFHESLFKKKSFNPVDYSEQCRTFIATGVWPSCCYLQDSGCKLASPPDSTASELAVYGSPWQPEHCNMAFGLPRGAALKAKWECIPQHTDVLITHTPPYGIMDQAADGTLCGCEELLTAVKERVRPRLHVFGHIHEGHGVSYDGTTLFVNAAVCDASYSPTNPAIVVDLPLDRSLPAVVVNDAQCGAHCTSEEYTADTHSRERQKNIVVPNGDILIHAGDFTSTGTLSELTHFKSFIDGLPHQQKIIIAGNHDITLQTDYYPRRSADFHPSFPKKIPDFDPVAYSAQCREVITPSSWPAYSYLEDSECKLANPPDGTATSLSVYGAPWQPEFYDWAYNLPRGRELKEKWDMIPNDTDVLITHGPPHGVLDAAMDGFLCGCEELLDAVTTRVKPRLHVFGHIHEGYGAKFVDNTLFVNACTCTYAYRPTNPPIVIDLPLDRSLPAVVVACGEVV